MLFVLTFSSINAKGIKIIVKIINQNSINANKMPIIPSITKNVESE